MANSYLACLNFPLFPHFSLYWLNPSLELREDIRGPSFSTNKESGAFGRRVVQQRLGDAHIFVYVHVCVYKYICQLLIFSIFSLALFLWDNSLWFLSFPVYKMNVSARKALSNLDNITKQDPMGPPWNRPSPIFSALALLWTASRIVFDAQIFLELFCIC